MRAADELLDRGVRAYARGDVREAQRLWTEAIAQDPGDERPRDYLALLDEAVPESDPRRPVALPPPADGAPPAPAQPRRGEAAVRLPAPDAAAPAGPGAPAPRTTLSDWAPSPWDQGPAAASAVVVLGDGAGLDLASIADASDLRPLVPDRAGPAPVDPPDGAAGELEALLRGARDLHALGDFSGSLELIERVLLSDPGNAEARAYLHENESTLIAMYESKLGPPDARPRLAIAPEEVMWLSLDHRAGFLLAQVDGSVSYEDLFAVSGLPRLDTARILATLLADGVITS